MNIDLSKRPFYLNKEDIAWVEETLKNLTLEEKVGQLFVCMGQDYTLSELLQLAEEGMIGGVLFRPTVSAKEMDGWFRPLDTAVKVPLFKAANLEEGGSGGILDGTLFGWPMLSAAADNDEDVRHFAKVCAFEGRSAGINITYSPVSDLDLNCHNPITNVRTNGSDLERVKRNTALYVDEVQKAGVAAFAKHFPGDGVDFRDHHLHPSYNSLPAKEWYDTYGTIYENLIAHDLYGIMVGHIVQPYVEMDINPSLSFEECLPGSLSKELLQGVLREKYHFNGVITTDATIMGGYCMSMERRRALPASIEAGNDMIVFNTDLREDYGYMLEAAKTGELSKERLDEAVLRILALKRKICFAPLDQEEYANTLIHAKQWQAQCADHAITLVKNLGSRRKEGGAILPVTKEKYPSIRLITLGKDDFLGGSILKTATDFLRARGFEVEHYDPYADNLHGTKDLDPSRLTIYLANYEHASNQTVVRIDWCKKHALDTPRYIHEEDFVFISFANPYHLMDVPRIPVYINAYTATKATIESALGKVLGESAFTGVSPVDAFCGMMDTRL